MSISFRQLISQLPVSLVCAGLIITAFYAVPVNAALLQFEKTPLIITQSVIPNVVFQLDDSGSMDFELLTGRHFSVCAYDASHSCTTTTVSSGRIYDDTGVTDDGDRLYGEFSWIFDNPDNPYGTTCTAAGFTSQMEECLNTGFDIDDQDWRARSLALNTAYFDPNGVYNPWRGASFTNASFTAARWNPQPGTPGYTATTKDLSGFVYHHWVDDSGYSGAQPTGTNKTTGANGIVDLWDSHIRVTVNSGSFECRLVTHTALSTGITTNTTTLTTTDPQCIAATGGKTPAVLAQDVANWFQYYRKRSMVTKAAVAETVVELPNFYYGMDTINSGNANMVVPIVGDNNFATNNSALLQTYFNRAQPALGTPLRTGLQRVGEYYRSTGSSAPITAACQKNFSILFTDGFWNGADPTGIADQDGDGGSINGTTTLVADVADWYYDNDLRTDLDNLVPIDPSDTADYQHMVTYTMAFGVSGSLTDTDNDGWPDPVPASGSPWYLTGAPDPLRSIDDLWHAAWNSKGAFISASNPQDVVLGLRRAIANVIERLASGAAGASNGGTFSLDSKIYQVSFNSGGWTGELTAIDIDSDGTLAGTASWQASDFLNARSNAWFSSTRKIFSYNTSSGSGISFKYNNLSSTQQTHFNDDPDTAAIDNDGEGADRVEYIRGVNTHEGQGNNYQPRMSRLGDIVNSNPEFVGAPKFFYGFDNYFQFITNNRSRTPVLYVGANDGMLHAFDAESGDEVFAYVPGMLSKTLPKLTRQVYTHEFFVDGSPKYGDARINGSWKSVLAGSLRSGGQGIYALDVTDPDNFSANNVLWEFSDADDADLGYTYGTPQIALMNNGKWAVIFGNGYNNSESDGNASTSGDGALYILFIEGGMDGTWSPADFVKLSVSAGSVDTPNGLSTPGLMDVNNDGKVDYIYAGDLEGNVWKFDVADSTTSNWKVAFSSQPFYTAQIGSARQPITGNVVVKPHPFGIEHGVLTIFGTGKFIEQSDNTTVGQDTQSVYGIWDRDTNPTATPLNEHDFNRSQLSSNTLTTSAATRSLAENNITWYQSDGTIANRGWYVDLPDTGERIVKDLQLRDNVVFALSLTPDTGICSAGGTGWVMGLDANNGGAPLAGSPFDPNPGGGTSIIGEMTPSIPNVPIFVYVDPAVSPPLTSGGGGPPPVPPPDLSQYNYDNPRPFTPGGMANMASACEGEKVLAFTTLANGTIRSSTLSANNAKCRQSWRQRR